MNSLKRPSLSELPQQVKVGEFRLRHLLLLALMAGVIGWSWPRGLASWRLHNRAVSYANYALCMVGPTGPVLLREQPNQFAELVRRRVVSAAPARAPLRSCETLAQEIEVSHAAQKLHGLLASEFKEYQNGPESAPRPSLADLDLSLERLEALANSAWPFVRGGGLHLMVASSHAKEASHSPAPPKAGRGRGLPARRQLYRSTVAYGDTVVLSLGSGANGRTFLSKNGGMDWVPGGAGLAGEIRGRCMADDEGRAFTLSRTNDGRRIVLSQGPKAAPQIAVLSKVTQEIAGISCDGSALVAALVLPPDETGHRPVRLRLCPFRLPCKDLTPPETGGEQLYYPVDVARIGGDTVLSRSFGGITRVSSSRDDGRSWLPWIVAFDHDSAASSFSPPFRLLVSGDDLMLYGGSNLGEPYALLTSRDHGASFRTPLRAQSTEGSQALLPKAKAHANR